MRRTEDHHTAEEKAMMLDIIMDEIENGYALKELPPDYKRSSRAAYVGYQIVRTLIDNSFMETGEKITQQKLEVS